METGDCEEKKARENGFVPTALWHVTLLEHHPIDLNFQLLG